MSFFIDNNLSASLARGMQAFGEDVIHLTDLFSPDEEDTAWLRHVGNEGHFLVTRDLRIRYRPGELQALREHGVGAFFLAGKNRTSCELIQQLVRNWPRIKEHAARERRPFAVSIPSTGTKFRKMEI